MILPDRPTDELDQDFWDDVFSNAPESWDDDVAAEAILIGYIHHLEEEVEKAGRCLLPECHWEWGLPCDHGYLPIETDKPTGDDK